jgi:hypothetical protein
VVRQGAKHASREHGMNTGSKACKQAARRAHREQGMQADSTQGARHASRQQGVHTGSKACKQTAHREQGMQAGSKVCTQGARLASRQQGMRAGSKACTQEAGHEARHAPQMVAECSPHHASAQIKLLVASDNSAVRFCTAFSCKVLRFNTAFPKHSAYPADATT